jgi:hypothetical protein
MIPNPSANDVQHAYGVLFRETGQIAYNMLGQPMLWANRQIADARKRPDQRIVKVQLVIVDDDYVPASLRLFPN